MKATLQAAWDPELGAWTWSIQAEDPERVPFVEPVGSTHGAHLTLEYEELAELGLDELADSLSEQAGREVNFMIFENATDAINRSPSIVVPR